MNRPLIAALWDAEVERMRDVGGVRGGLVSVVRIRL